MRPLFVCLLMMTSASFSLAAEGLALYDELRSSVVTVKGSNPLPPQEGRIQTLETTGAGVILDATGVIATNTHVIYGAPFIEVTLKTGETMNARVLYVAPYDDVSILKVEPARPLVPVGWADSNLAQLGDEVVTIGHSALLKSTISGGHIRAIGVRKGDDTRTPEFLELDINHYQGDSGGPVFDRQGRFLGLMNAKRMTEGRACLVVPSNKVHFAYLSLANISQTR